MAVMNDGAKNLEDVHDRNLGALIRLMLKKHVCSRAELAQAIELRQSTVTNLMNELIDCGLAAETGSIDGKKGRRSIGVTLVADRFCALGIRLSRTYFSAGLFRLDGLLLQQSVEELPAGITPSALLDRMEQSAHALITRSQCPVTAVGLSTPGPLEPGGERMAFVTGAHEWAEIPFRTELESRLKLPVCIEQDANAGALAELWFGDDRFSRETFVYLAAGQGIGAGIMEDGQIFHGGTGMAGEIGHMSVDYNGPSCQCGNKGCLELYCSTTALLQNIRICIDRNECAIPFSELSLERLARACAEQDTAALEQTDRVFWFLGRGIVNLINLYGPDTVIIGDELAIFGERLIERVRETVAQYVQPAVFKRLQLRLTGFAVDPAFPGAAAAAFERLLQKPTIWMNAQK